MMFGAAGSGGDLLPTQEGPRPWLHNVLSLAAALTQSVFALLPLLLVPTEPFVEPGCELNQL